jgi:hypothetical protein
VVEGSEGTVRITWLDTDPIIWISSWQVEGEVAERDSAEHRTADAAVRWSRERCGRVVIIGRDGEVYWVGSDPLPHDVEAMWDDASPQAR